MDGSRGEFCLKGQVSCSALGEPAVLQFSTGDDGAHAVHAGASWLSDPESDDQCDGPTEADP